MKGFIEVKEKDSGIKVLLSVNKILSISPAKDNSTFIELGMDCNGDSIGFFTCAPYESIVNLIKDFA